MSETTGPIAIYAGRINLQALKSAVKAGNITVHAALYVEADGVLATIPVYDPRKDETMVRILVSPAGHVHVYKTLQATKNAMHKCGITRYSIVRDGVECWV